MKWIEDNLAKAVTIAVFLLVILAALFLRECSAERTAKVETHLAQDQASASLASGADAVNSTGIVEGNATSADIITKENHDAIQNAQGANVLVTPAVRDAGLASLCRRASYRRDPKCVQYLTSH